MRAGHLLNTLITSILLACPAVRFEPPPGGEIQTVATGEDHDQIAQQLDEQAKELEQESERLAGKIDRTREEWEARRRDPGVPGANAPADNEEPDEDEDEDEDAG